MNITVTFDDEDTAILESEAKKEGIESDELIFNIVQEYLEDIELAKRGEEAYKEFIKGDGKTYSSDELRKEFGL